MKNIDKLLEVARIIAECKKKTDFRDALARMTTEQLLELAEGDPSDERVREIFESVGFGYVLDEDMESW